MSQLVWDRRFLDMAALVAGWSKDPNRGCGAVIVRPDRTVASTGFNGFPKGCRDDADLYADRDLKLERIIHAEVNAILHARESLAGYTLYSWPPHCGPSCARCAACIVQSGITRVVYCHEEKPGSNWRDSIQRGIELLAEAGVEVVRA